MPFFISWPGHIKPGTTIDAPVAHIDLMPTFADAAKAPIPASDIIDGADLMPLATGDPAANPTPHDAIFWESDYYQVVRQGDWKLQTTKRPEKTWLFNLKDDPTEHHDLAAEMPDKVAELAQLLADHRKDAVAPLYPSTTQSPVAIDKTAADHFEKGDEYIYWPN